MGFLRAIAPVLLFSTAAHAGPVIDGFRIGDRFSDDMAGHLAPESVGNPARYVPRRWTLPNGTTLSVTTDTRSGRVVFIEQDGAGRPIPSSIPGLTLGETSLADIQARFGSNGFGFASNGAAIQDGMLLATNCYRLRDTASVLVVVTRQPLDAVPVVDGTPTPDTRQGILDAVILSDRPYLDRIWGPGELRDPAERPVVLPQAG